MLDLPILDAVPTGDGAAAGTPTPGAPSFWRSPEHRERSAAFQAQHRDEFMPEAAAAPAGTNRRQFLQLAGASVALAGLTACRRPVEKILPYTRKPVDVIEGIAQYYATAMPHRGIVHGLLAESHEGRPTKVEGNPDHPVARGTAGLFEQASVLNLYDPDRSRRVLRAGRDASWADFLAAAPQLTGPVAVLAEPSSSPTRARLRTALEARFPGLRWVTYRPEGDDPFALATQAAYGRPLRPVYDFEQADVIVSLDADFLGSTDLNEGGNSRSFAAARRPERGQMPRFYAVESTFSTTGALADHRLRLKPSAIAAFAQSLAGRVGGSAPATGTAPAVPGAAPAADSSRAAAPADPGEQSAAAGRTGDEGETVAHAQAAPAVSAAAFLDALVDDLRGKRAVVIAGPTMPPYVHGLALRMTAALGGVGTALQLLDTGDAATPGQAAEVAGLVNAMRAGQVRTLVMLGVNPVYDAPGALRFADALTRVPNTIHVGPHRDETAARCAWHLPAAHYLEMWGDGRAYDGTLSVIQPLIAPLNEKIEATASQPARERDDVHSDLEILNVLATGQDVSGYDLVRATWQGQIAGAFEEGWRRVLHEGFVPNTAFAAAGVGAPGALPPAAPVPTGDLEIAFRLDPTVLDGSYTNNGWLIELPDPVTKLVWDNVATMSRATAERLGLAVAYSEGRFHADRIELDVNGRKEELPVWIVPGHANDCVTVTMGWGRQIAGIRPKRDSFFFNVEEKTDMYGQGPIGNGVGRNVAPLREASFAATAPVRVRKVASDYTLVSTQEHGSMEGRAIILEGTLAEYQADPRFVAHETPHVPGGGLWETEEGLWGADRHPRTQDFYKDNPYHRNQWGMVVDLTSCTGCSACVVACNAENNIQVVGKTEVGKGRELHWLRMDRYFIGNEDDPRMAFQYLTCVHCENAPCESVCPVAATYHSPDGTNQMIYNRCIGTRYCSNNCPYKVRRYNWFNWTKTLPLTVQMQQNPDVTVRFRGVMEKCSYCVQRIREADDRTNLEGGRPIRDGEVQTACQQACAAGAITFGNLADPASKVSVAKQNPRRYELLAELGTRPRTSYLARVRNPNPRLEPAEPHANVEPHPAGERDDVNEAADPRPEAGPARP